MIHFDTILNDFNITELRIQRQSDLWYFPWCYQSLSYLTKIKTMFVLQAHFMSQNKIGTNICFTLNLLGHHFDYDHHFIMVFILRPFFHKLGSQEDLQRISFMLPVSEIHCCSENIVDFKIIKDQFETLCEQIFKL